MLHTHGKLGEEEVLSQVSIQDLADGAALSQAEATESNLAIKCPNPATAQEAAACHPWPGQAADPAPRRKRRGDTGTQEERTKDSVILEWEAEHQPGQAPVCTPSAAKHDLWMDTHPEDHHLLTRDMPVNLALPSVISGWTHRQGTTVYSFRTYL
ncbi:hypothetical protein P7K49_024669 [Saguinus oedipus]|uniref:Uncharacterized protein n=1 Tax=Saguinus oedipus TaxID=9490 RepID=A0ABQ9URT9_SAGOE|nr:hypothetical protein P7K49_024669 [Saguinus oedipus]